MPTVHRRVDHEGRLVRHCDFVDVHGAHLILQATRLDPERDIWDLRVYPGSMRRIIYRKEVEGYGAVAEYLVSHAIHI